MFRQFMSIRTNFKTFLNDSGLLLLKVRVNPDALGQYRIPGGKIEEEEFLNSGKCSWTMTIYIQNFFGLIRPSLSEKKSSNGKVQLQIAAREAAARQLLRDTGIDIQYQLDRMTPAVLYNDPPSDEK